MDYAEPDLDRAIDELVKESTRYPGKRETFLADFALYAFIMDVREHAIAVAVLSAGPVPRASLANARAALESAIDAALLTQDESQYLVRGAQARVAELFELHEIQKRAAPLKVPLPADATAPMHPDDAIVEDARAWDEQAPGKGIILRRAWETFFKDKGNHRRHWSLLSKEQLYETVFGSDADGKLGGMGELILALLAQASHPRMRVGARDIQYTSDNDILFGTRTTDAEMARQIAALSCKMATQALQRRRLFTSEAA
jgi:hypothetical protein